LQSQIFASTLRSEVKVALNKYYKETFLGESKALKILQSKFCWCFQRFRKNSEKWQKSTIDGVSLRIYEIIMTYCSVSALIFERKRPRMETQAL